MSNTTTEKTAPTTACCGPTCCVDEGAEGRAAAEVTAVVREKYGSTARSGLSNNDEGVRTVAEAFGYSPEELSAIPAEANMGLSCGNPTASASLKPGEVVVDLGCGGGLDVFLAAQKVGPAGKAIGVDMTPEMIGLSKKNAAKSGITNAEFHLGTIDNVPLPGASADVVISNCVINLAPDKRAVFREIARILKPGGRLAVSDIALKKPLPPEIANDLMAYVGCVAGAIRIEEYRAWLTEAGFASVAVIDSGADLNAYSKVEGQSGCCSPAKSSPATPSSAKPSALPLATGGGCCGGTTQSEESSGVHDGLAEILRRYDVNDYAASVKVYALKPG
jgi:arsenite methyltransferase